MSNITGLEDILDKNIINDINNLVEIFRNDKNIELETRILGIDYGTYMYTLEQLIDEYEDITVTEYLDVNINLDNYDTLRITFLDDIENVISKLNCSKNEIMDYIVELFGSENVEFMIKENSKAIRHKIDEIGIVVKTVPEIIVDNIDKIKKIIPKKILFRKKTRTSIMINKSVRCDITEIQTSGNINNLSKAIETYEIELEATDHKIKSSDYMKSIELMLLKIRKTEILITKSEQNEVISKYSELIEYDRKLSHLISRNVISLERQHLHFIPNKYAVTDKPDGERCFLMCFDTG